MATVMNLKCQLKDYYRQKILKNHNYKLPEDGEVFHVNPKITIYLEKFTRKIKISYQTIPKKINKTSNDNSKIILRRSPQENSNKHVKKILGSKEARKQEGHCNQLVRTTHVQLKTQYVKRSPRSKIVKGTQ